jgi:predicted MPP superfamily phosphohydrolase
MSLSRAAFFFAVVLALTFGLHYFLWARLVRDTALAPPYGRILTIALVVLGALLPLALLAMRAPRAIAAPVSWVAFTWMGFMFLLFAALLPAEIVRQVGKLFTGPDPARRAFLARTLGAVVAGVGFVGGGVGVVNALRAVRHRKITVKLAKLPAALSGYRIVQLTDVHVGPTIGRSFVEDIVRRVNALEPDLVAITGDLVDGTVAELAHHVEPIRDLRAKDGVFFVTGNHEYYSGVDEWLAHLGTLGVRVLRNERVAIRGGGASASRADAEREGFDLAGVDDAHANQYGHGHGMDVARALAGRDDSRACVLLAHQPKAIGEAAKLGACLQISGHTHAGQIFPFTYFVKLDQPYVRGLHRRDGTQIYVSEGTGYWGPPMRLGTWAEITTLELQRLEA